MMHSIPRYLSSHRKILLFVPIVLGLLFWTAAVALADDKNLKEPDASGIAEKALTSVKSDGGVAPMIAYKGTYEKYGFRNKSKLIAAPFFDSGVLKKVAIANAYRSRKFADDFDELCSKMVAGEIALVRKGKAGKFEIVPPAEYGEGGPVQFRTLLSQDDSYLLTSARSISERSPDVRLVSWDAESSLGELRGLSADVPCRGP